MKKLNVMGFLAGASIGVLIGILYAPDKGSKTRKKLYRKGEQAVDELKDKAYLLAAYTNAVSNELDRLTDKIDASIEKAGREAANKVGKAFTKLAEGKEELRLKEL